MQALFVRTKILSDYAEAVLTSTHNLCFEQKFEKVSFFLFEMLHFFGGNIFYIFE